GARPSVVWVVTSVATGSRLVGPPMRGRWREEFRQMNLNLFRQKTRRRELEDRHQPNAQSLQNVSSGPQVRVVAPAGAAGTRFEESESETVAEWPWWLSSPNPGAPSGRGWDGDDVGRRWSLQQDEKDDATSPSAA